MRNWGGVATAVGAGTGGLARVLGTGAVMPAAGIIADLAALLPGGERVTAATLEAASAAGGAYALAVELRAPLRIPLRGAEWPLAAGLYVYAGSARGPGGIRARLRHHFRADKRLHWHIDRLTVVAGSLAALSFDGGAECAIVTRLLASGEWAIALPGFGSSDCRHCAAHLLMGRALGNAEPTEA